MLKISKIFLVMSLVMVLVSAVGCSQQIISEEELANKIVETHEKIKTVKFDMDISVKTDFKIGENIETTNMNMTGNGAMDNVNNTSYMKMLMEMNMPPMGISEETETLNSDMEIYIIDNTMYSKSVMKVGEETIPAEWIKMEIAPDYNPMPVDYFIDLLQEASEIKILSDEKVDGIECYVVKLTPDMNKFLELMAQQIQMLVGDIPIEPTIIDDLSQLFEQLDITYWIAKDTFFPIKEHINITMVINPETLGKATLPEDEGLEMKFFIETTSNYHSYNEPVAIELPEEAKNAKTIEETLALQTMGIDDIDIEGTVTQINPDDKTIKVITMDGDEKIIQVIDATNIISIMEDAPITFESIKPEQKIAINIDANTAGREIEKAEFIIVLQ